MNALMLLIGVLDIVCGLLFYKGSIAVVEPNTEASTGVMVGTFLFLSSAILLIATAITRTAF